MKSKDLQNIVLSKYQENGTSTETHCHLNGGISLSKIKGWCQMIHRSGSIHLLGTRADPRIVGALERISRNLKTVYAENRKYQLENFRESSGFLCNKYQMNIKNRFRVQTLYEMVIEPSLSDDQKIKRKQFAN